MYANGIGVDVDCEKAVAWAEKIVEFSEREYGKKHPFTCELKIDIGNCYNNLFLRALFTKGVEYALTMLEDAVELLSEAYDFYWNCGCGWDPNALKCLQTLAESYITLGDNESMEFNDDAIGLCETAYGLYVAHHPTKLPEMETLLSIILQVYKEIIPKCCKKHMISCNTRGENDPETQELEWKMKRTVEEYKFYKREHEKVLKRLDRD
jgi:hypothetical protein